MNNSATANEAIALPKGGGAIKGIGETFQPNLFSGTGNHSIPIAISPGRGGFGPTLSLQYSSGNGNGPFGLGWQLSVPRITRKTEKGLPRYNDSDVFVMSGAEDLVPCLKSVIDPATGKKTWEPEDPVHRPLHTAYRYRPRTEGLFARIERWENDATREVHWRATTKDNITSIYGGSPASRIADPDNAHHVYEWLLEETFDAAGNHIRYEYAKDNPALYAHDDPGIDLPAIFDRNRNATQLYLRRIYYGNLPSPLLDSHGNAVTYPDGTPIGHERDGRRYAFEVLFDYGGWPIPTKKPHPDPAPDEQELFGPDPSRSASHNPVPIREDCFSSFRGGFEVRTLRRCRRILMFHHFAELGSPTLVRSTDFTYENNPETRVSFLTAVTVTGYQKDASGYDSASMPPVTFTYAEFRPQEQRYQSMVAQGNDMPPQALNNPDFALVDLFGDGLPDVLHSSPAGFRYWRNLGEGHLDRPRAMAQVPAGIALSQPGVGFGDMGGDGQADLLVHSAPLAGFFETTPDGTWQTFKPYDVFPSFDLADPNVRLVDLTGNGLSDALMSRDQHFLWFECLGEQGFAAPKSIPRQYDLDTFPDVFFNDPEGRVRLADMTGDGLHDIVWVHNGSIDYWPNLGYGRFGKRVTMANAPRLDRDFQPNRLFLADLNGTGCADLVYVDFDRVHFWFNQSGNRWSEQQTICGTPRVSDIDSIQFADVFGTGTATLLWSYDIGAQRDGNYKALDFCGGIKPYVLTEMSNNMGATTRVRYAASTKYFRQDQADGTPWVTRLPFPVQVVDKVEVIDHVGKTKLVTTYKYHHGYFDGREREFRGFGRVDQLDTETFDDFTGPGLHGNADLFDNDSSAYHVPPVETRSWFHTGIYFDEDSSAGASGTFDYRELTNRFRKEFYQGDEAAVALDEHDVETGDTPHEAYRALRGAVLRTEVYAHDGTAKADHPFQVTDNRYHVHQIQPKNGNHHGVYFSSQMESVSYQYERNPTDPRISHALTLQVDAFGNALKSLAIGYGRRQPDPALPTQADHHKQTQTLITYSANTFTNGIDDPDNYRTPLPSETRTYELTGFTPADNAKRFSFTEWVANDFAQLAQAQEIGYEDTADFTTKQKRLIEQVRTRYRKDDLTALLPVGVIESLALPGEGYKLAFTPQMLTAVYGSRIANVDLPQEGGYVHEGDSNWWIPSGRIFCSPKMSDNAAEELTYARQHFFLTHRTRDPFGNTAFQSLDPYDLLVNHTNDPLGNTASAEHDYRVLQPFRVTDPNGNRAEVAFDTLGLVAGSAVMGKTTETTGDTLAGFEPNLTVQQRRDFLVDPLGNAAHLLGRATTRIVYDLDQYVTTQQPIFAATLTRETHVSDLVGQQQSKIQISFSYSDGFGRAIQKKIQAEPGPLEDGGPTADPRWVGSGWTILNNKAKPVRQYEPFFSKHQRADGTFFSDHRFEFGVKLGVSPTLFYDPLERVVATLHPNHTWEKVLFDPWRQETWDVNDTVLIADPKTDTDVGDFFHRLPDGDYLPTWHAQRQPGGAMDAHEQAAATKAAAHADTPTRAYFDTLGRAFLTVAHNKVVCPGHDLHGTEDSYATRVELDVEGNQREVRDERRLPVNYLPTGAFDQRVVMRYDYDMLGNRIHQLSMEAGARWMLNDVGGKPIRAWDSRGHNFTTTYDALRRPVEQTVRGTSPDSDPRTLNRDILVDKIQYGEPAPNATPTAEAEAQRLNLRTRIYRHYDSAGVVTSARLDANGDPVEAFDFKGNLLHSTRRLLSDYTAIPDWLHNPQLDAETFEAATRYDALNRPIQTVAPHSSVARAKRNVIQPVFNEANLLERVDVWLERDTEPAALLNPNSETPSAVGVADIDYNAKGQRLRIDYKNGASTFYSYDRLTFRLRQLITRRDAAAFPGDDPQPPVAGWPGRQVQNLRYTYDPAGNITHIHDDAQQTIFFRNQRVEPSNDYTYDSLYRLIQATGREHLGQTNGQPNPPTPPDAFNTFHTRLPHPNERDTMGSYTEQYVYDAVGNFQKMQHRGSDPAQPDWTRAYDYLETSLIENGNGGALLKMSNRLSSTTLNPNGANPLPEPYLHDAHGNIVRMPHLGGGAPGPNMHWDYKDQLRQVDLGGGGTAFYVYDAAGQRMRKIWEKSPGLTEERIYLGGFEIFRTHAGPIGANTAVLERETLHVMDDKQRIALVEMRTLDIAHNDPAPARLIRYQFGNHLGSAILELDDRAQIISYEEYTPYGSTAYQAVRNQTETPKRYRYTGKERDEESGLYYHGARYYAAWLARWISSDPLGIQASINPFSYCRGNPVIRTDPNGQEDEYCFTPGCGTFAPREFLKDVVYGTGEGLFEGGKNTVETIDRLDRGLKRGINRVITDPGGAVEDLDSMLKNGAVIEGFIDQGKHLYQQYEMFVNAVDRGQVRSAARILNRNALEIGVQVAVSEALGAAWGPVSRGLGEMSFAESSLVRAESRALTRAATAEVRPTGVLAEATAAVETRVAAAAQVLDEAMLRVRIVQGLEDAAGVAETRMRAAVMQGDAGVLGSVGLTQGEVQSLISRDAKYNRRYGRSVELATEQIVRADPFLSQYVEYVANGRVPPGVNKPDWIINTPSSRIPVDISTPEVLDTRMRQMGMHSQRTKWSVEKGLNLTYQKAP